MYSDISAYITHLRRDQKERIVYISAKQLPDDGFAIGHNSIVLSFVHEPHCNAFLYSSENDSIDTEADSENVCINLQQPAIRTHMYISKMYNCSEVITQ